MLPTVGWPTVLRAFWAAGKPDLEVLSSLQEGDFRLQWPWHNTYVIQTHDNALRVLAASSKFTRTYAAFARAAELELDFTALSGPDDVDNITGIHDAFRLAMHADWARVPALINKHFAPVFLSAPIIDIDSAFDNFFNTVWCDYVFGRPDLVPQFAGLRTRIMAVMHERFFRNKWKGVDPTGLSTWLYLTSESTEELRACKAEIWYMVEDSTPDSWAAQFVRPLSKRAAQDVMFDMFFIPSFLKGTLRAMLHDTIGMHEVNNQDPKKAFEQALRDEFLYPLRGRILCERVVLGDGTVLAPGSTVFVNLVAAKLYHSSGARHCVGQYFTHVFSRAFADALKHVSFARVGDMVQWTLSRKLLQPLVPHHEFGTTKFFYDVLSVTQTPLLFQLTVQRMTHVVQEIILAMRTSTSRVNFDRKVVLVTPVTRGIPWASAVAQKLGLPLVIVREAGGNKMPKHMVVTAECKTAYGATKTYEIPERHLATCEDAFCIVCDDGIAGGDTALACAKLVAKASLLTTCEHVVCVINHTYGEPDSPPGSPKLTVHTLFDFVYPPPL